MISCASILVASLSGLSVRINVGGYTTRFRGQLVVVPGYSPQWRLYGDQPFKTAAQAWLGLQNQFSRVFRIQLLLAPGFSSPITFIRHT
jgi:hypothetical protein